MARDLGLYYLSNLRSSKISEILESFGKARKFKISAIFGGVGVGDTTKNLDIVIRIFLASRGFFRIIYLSLIICMVIRRNALG